MVWIPDRDAVPPCRTRLWRLRFPKDVQAFIHLAASVGVDFDILKATERVNKQRIDVFLEKVRKALWVIKGKQVRSWA